MSQIWSVPRYRTAAASGPLEAAACTLQSAPQTCLRRWDPGAQQRMVQGGSRSDPAWRARVPAAASATLALSQGCVAGHPRHPLRSWLERRHPDWFPTYVHMLRINPDRLDRVEQVGWRGAPPVLRLGWRHWMPSAVLHCNRQLVQPGQQRTTRGRVAPMSRAWPPPAAPARAAPGACAYAPACALALHRRTSCGRAWGGMSRKCCRRLPRTPSKQAGGMASAHIWLVGR